MSHRTKVKRYEKIICFANEKRDVGTQTSDMDTLLEIACLQEQVRLLKIENEHLRKNIYTVEEFSTILKPTIYSPSLNKANKILEPIKSKQESPQIENTKKRHNRVTYGCSCKRNCSTKVCGCVKKHIQCGESCRCSNVCQNQEHKDEEKDKENIENHTLMYMDHKTVMNKYFVNVTVSKSPLSPNVTTHKTTPNTELLLKSDEGKEGNEVEEKNMKQTVREYDQNNRKDVTKKRGIPRKNNSKVVKSFEQKQMDLHETKDSDQRELSNDYDFNPMKPKHELARTPVRGNRDTNFCDIINASITAPVDMEGEKFLALSELNAAEVDWDKYQSRLIPCSKCNRKFHSFRIKKHESCCKKV